MNEFEAESAVIAAALAYRVYLAGIADEASSGEEYELACAIDELENARKPGWVLRTMEDVRAGDLIRLPEAPHIEVAVRTCMALDWHVRQGEHNRFGDRPENHRVVRMRGEYEGMTDPDHQFEWPANKPVQISLTAGEATLVEGFGWPNRLGLESR